MVYLAGPDVFLPDAEEVGARKKAICEAVGLEPLWPADLISDLTDPGRLFADLVAGLDRADACIANCTPWRGGAMDPGTAFEMGYLQARGARVVGYTNDARDLKDRIEADGSLVEDYGLADNVMIEGPGLLRGERLVRVDVPPELRWSDLAGFQVCAWQLSQA
jgi:nucleoside 2-deoxyribosyltransferase